MNNIIFVFTLQPTTYVFFTEILLVETYKRRGSYFIVMLE